MSNHLPTITQEYLSDFPSQSTSNPPNGHTNHSNTLRTPKPRRFSVNSTASTLLDLPTYSTPNRKDRAFTVSTLRTPGTLLNIDIERPTTPTLLQRSYLAKPSITFRDGLEELESRHLLSEDELLANTSGTSGLKPEFKLNRGEEIRLSPGGYVCQIISTRSIQWISS